MNQPIRMKLTETQTRFTAEPMNWILVDHNGEVRGEAVAVSAYAASKATGFSLGSCALIIAEASFTAEIEILL